MFNVLQWPIQGQIYCFIIVTSDSNNVFETDYKDNFCQWIVIHNSAKNTKLFLIWATTPPKQPIIE